MDILAAAQALLTESPSNPDEEMQMFIADVPYIPVQEASVLVAEAGVGQGEVQAYDRVIGICHLSANPYDPTSAQNSMSPPLEVKSYYRHYEKEQVQGPATASVLKMPEHGKLIDEGEGYFSYFPDKGFLGNDRATLLVEMGGKKIRMEYFFRVLESVVENESEDNYADFCPEKVRVWKISSLKDAYGNDFITAVNISASQTAGVDAVVTDPSALSSWLKLAELSGNLADMSGVNVRFAELSGGAAGQTTGGTITLDLTAAGHGWYIDPTPLDNTDDYLPTSNPDVWQAKAGTDAAGKMDLLSVLLHEYGHALGLDHNSDSSDFMAATLKPGERRVPSAEELQLMSELVAQLKAGDGGGQTPTTPSPLVPSVPLGALLLGRLAGRRTEEADQGSQALFAAHPTLQGGGLQNLQDWATQGQVSVASGGAGTGGATLQEASSSQTRLNQVFMVGPNDRYLSFTLSNLALDDQAAGPDDAFEAALLNADTGANLMASNGLTRSDALLNLQANGSEFAAQGVTHVTHADGSRSYLVDLAGMARNVDGSVAVNLSFDLIGFGQNGSHVTVSDVRLFGQPQATDDVASGAEDAVLTIAALANDENANLPGLAPVVVAAPAHGTVVANADGSLS